MTYHGATVTEADTPRLNGIKGDTLRYMQSRHGQWVTVPQIVSAIRAQGTHCREDSPRRMISYLKDDGYMIESQRDGAMAQYRYTGMAEPGQRRLF